MPVVSFARQLNKESVETIVIIVPEALDLPTIQIIHNSPRSILYIGYTAEQERLFIISE